MRDEFLLTYPFVVFRLGCRYCPRVRAYRLIRLGVEFGCEADIHDVMRRLAADCALETQQPEGCGGYLPDLEPPMRPPDNPGGKSMRAIKCGKALRVIAGGEETRMSRGKGEITNATIDKEFPHQVALRADLASGSNTRVVEDFCRKLTVAPRHHTVRRDDEWYIVMCFADAAHAELFRGRFGGEPFNPKDRGRGNKSHVWRSIQSPSVD